MKYTIEGCREKAQWYAALADYMQEGETIIAQGQQPAMDEAQQLRVVKLVYVSMQSMNQAAQWAFDNIPGYAPNITRARARIDQDVFSTPCDDSRLDSYCGDVYGNNRRSVNRRYN